MRRLCACLLTLSGCAGLGLPPVTLLPPVSPPVALQAEARPAVHPPFVLRNVTVWTASGKVFAPGHVAVEGGLITQVGPGEGLVPDGGVALDGQGGHVTPGLIDTHSHMGVYPMPGALAHQDGNEATAPVTAHVQAQHSFWPQDPALWRATSGGITTLQVLPGSANVIGGRGFVVHLKPEGSARAMKFPGARDSLKMACGENPKRVYGTRGREPSTRMGSVATLRASFQKAFEYRRARQKYARDLALWKARQTKVEGRPAPNTRRPDGQPDDPPELPPRDLGLETLAAVLDGEVLVQNHCYRADEMHQMLDVAAEFGFKIRSFHHAVEAYKLADRLAREDVSVSTWVDWWGFKLESFDGIPENVALVHAAGARAVLHSDSATEVRALNHEAAKARAHALKLGLQVSEDEALRWVTINPAWTLGLEDRLGTLERGKLGDLVLWSGHPLSIYSLATQVFVEGQKVYDRAQGPRLSDFELGQVRP